MAILQAILAMLTRQLGRFLNTAFGWATSLLFGKVPEKRQTYLSVIALGSVVWLVLAIGVAFPRVGTYLLAFVPLPDWVDDFWIRMLMLALAIILPPIVGFISLFLVDPADSPRGIAERTKAILRGYPYTIGLALTLVLMLIVAPIMKLRDIAKRWTSKHVPVVVEAEDYFEVLGDVERVLRAGGMESHRERASPLLRWPTKVFTTFAGGSVEDLVADELSVLRSEKIEVLLHPSDLVIHGREKDVMRAHALLTEHLTFTKAYLTWSKEAHELEDRLGALWREIESAGSDLKRDEAQTRLRDIERDLMTIEVSYEEWEVLFREKLVVERALLRAAMQPSHEPGSLAGEQWTGNGAMTRPAPPSGLASVVRLVASAVLIWKSLRGHEPKEA
jgi:hypothetical protein